MGKFNPHSIGLFWEDRPVSRKRGEFTLGPMPEIPETGWRPVTEFPNLSAAKVIGLDTETFDPNLRTKGPGWGRGDGHIVGVSLAVEDGTSWYFPMRHEVQTEMNMDPEQVLRFCRHVLGTNVPKVGANLIYDIGWLAEEHVSVRGPLYDVQFAEALLDSEAPSVALDDLAQRYLGIGKTTDILYEWLASWFGGAVNDKQRRNIYKSPPSLAGPYAESDAALPIRILEQQWPAMMLRGVVDLFDIECRLIPLLVAMRRKGAPVNTNRAEEVYEDLGKDLIRVEKQLLDIAGQPVNPNAGASLKSAFEKLSIPIPTTLDKKKGVEKQSFAAPLLEAMSHPLTDKIVEYRQIAKVRNTFVKGYILDKHVDGRIHCTFHPLKGDKNGARSGRFASSDPNLQNIPVRTELGRRVRTAFEASQGARWQKWDYSQIEYRLLAHHAVGPGSRELREIFINDPDADYHEVTIQLIKNLVGLDLERRPAKTINFGLIYGMSEKELMKRLGLSAKAGKELFASYHKAAPFAKATMEDAEQEANRYGTVTTLLGRKSDFNQWGPAQFEYGAPGLSYEKALLKYGRVARAYTHKALNRRLQGGAADIMKKAMVDAYEAGLFAEDACGIPVLTVHDELDFEDFNSPDNPAWAELRRVMENCVQTRVPIRIDQSVGPNWGDAD